ncbi:hypothetical protein [Paenibacillus ginsengarvi]|uniref:hypothetical protein n=1 Tax=Paenibacillus ginsengarvi TaxID=400777 RepID=UPI0013157D81|nr:hypothetical protein [Paenibacillus ginsengarvi]
MNNIVIRSTKRGFYFDKGSEANVVNNVHWNSGSESIESFMPNPTTISGTAGITTWAFS